LQFCAGSSSPSRWLYMYCDGTGKSYFKINFYFFYFSYSRSFNQLTLNICLFICITYFQVVHLCSIIDSYAFVRKELMLERLEFVNRLVSPFFVINNPFLFLNYFKVSASFETLFFLFQNMLLNRQIRLLVLYGVWLCF